MKINDQLRYSIAGFCMGIAELIPGISGAIPAQDQGFTTALCD